MRTAWLVLAFSLQVTAPYSTGEAKEPSPTEQASSVRASAEKFSVAKHVIPVDVSRAGFILSQVDARGLLHGMPERLGKALLPSRRQSETWKGVDHGGRLNLTIEYAGKAQGEVFVGFFPDVQWRTAEPVQVRRFPGPGNYSIDRLPLGTYWLGAMIGAPALRQALGINHNWPAPIVIEDGKSGDAKLVVSSQFQSDTSLSKFFLGEWEKQDPTWMITVRTLDPNGAPLPFCRLTIVERKRDEADKPWQFFEVGTDDRGYAYADQASGEFSLCVQSGDFVPDMLADRWAHKNLPRRYKVADRPVIEVRVEPFPIGTGKLSGRVRDQHGKPLTRFYLSLTRHEGERTTFNAEFSSFGIHVPITNKDGRFSIGQLAPGTYTTMIRHFDYPTHAWRFDGPTFVIEDRVDAEAQLDLEVEANELRYGVAVYEGGAPVSSGGWTALFEAPPFKFGMPDSFSLSLEPDGSFRVPLSKAQREKLNQHAKGRIRVYPYDASRDRTVEVAFDELATDPGKPTKVIIPGDVPSPEPAQQTEKQASAERPVVPVFSKLIEDTELVDTTGKSHRLSDYGDKVVLLNFAATWCGPCMQELPHLVELSKRNEKSGLVVLLICGDKEPEAAEVFAQQKKLPFVVLVDPEERLIRQFKDKDGQIALPTNAVLRQASQVKYVDSGYDEVKFASLTQAVEQELHKATAE